MPMSIIYWVLMLIWLVFGIGVVFIARGWEYSPVVSTVLLFLLFTLLGWKVFGSPVQQG